MMKPWEYYLDALMAHNDESEEPERPDSGDYTFTHEGVEEYNKDLESYRLEMDRLKSYSKKQPPYTEFHDDCRKHFEMESCELWPRIVLSTNTIMRAQYGRSYQGAFQEEFEVIKLFCELYTATKKSTMLELNSAFRDYEESEVDEEDHR